jgi:hypothetical protein
VAIGTRQSKRHQGKLQAVWNEEPGTATYRECVTLITMLILYNICGIILASLFAASGNQYYEEHQADRNEEPGAAANLRKCLF